MGAYLDVPKKEKETEAGTMDLGTQTAQKSLPFVVSSMQGWRKTMEDAHIAMTNLENNYDVPENTSLFAVFDGHGGKEVSKFCAKYFVDTLVELESFKARAYREALVEAFHEMDVLLRDRKFKEELMHMANDLPPPDMLADRDESLDTSPEEEDTEVKDVVLNHSKDTDSQDFERTFGKGGNRRASDDSLYADFSTLEKDQEGYDEFLDKHEHKMLNRAESTHFGAISGGSPKQHMLDDQEEKKPPPPPPRNNSREVKDSKPSEEKLDDEDKSDGNLPKPSIKTDDSVDSLVEEFGSNDNEEHPDPGSLEEGNTEVPQSEELDPEEARLKNQMEDADENESLGKTEALDLILQIMRLSTNRNKPNQAEERLEFDDHDQNLPTTAGTTACVALIIEGKIYVANAGDSRAVLCRNMQAKPMSFDHKPEQPIEKARIENAGGWVTRVGRVCGNLNLSRCIGDLKYKMNDSIGRADQVITAEPDVNVIDLENDDMFLVIACDGVWDIMTNDMIVEFIGHKFVEKSPNLDLKVVVEDVFERCICDDPMKTEGKGGDNMTCIIVCLKPTEELTTSFSTKYQTGVFSGSI